MENVKKLKIQKTIEKVIFKMGDFKNNKKKF